MNIAIFNRKGGTGKTTTSVNIAAGFALMGYEVELFGLDGQENELKYLGVKSSDVKYTFEDILKRSKSLKDVRIRVRDNLYVIPMLNRSVLGSNLACGEEQRPDLFFSKKIFKAEDTDVIRIFDCGPDKSFLNNAVLNYVDSLIIPCELEFGSVTGITALFDYLDELYIERSKVLKIIPTKHDSTTTESDKYMNMLKTALGEDMITPYISRNINIPRGQSNGKTIYELSYKDCNTYKTIQGQMNEIIRSVVTKWQEINQE